MERHSCKGVLMKLSLLALVGILSLKSFAGPLPLAPTFEEDQRSIQKNRSLSRQHSLKLWNQEPNTLGGTSLRPFSEVEEAGYLLFHADTYHQSNRIKDTLARELPHGVKLVVYTDQSYQLPQLKDHYGKLAGSGNVEVLGLSYSASDRAIWARDNTPIPVLLRGESSGLRWGAVDAVYYGGDEPDSALANWFHIPLQKNPYEFEGGNFVADSKGNCVIVNKSATAEIPDSIFQTVYGCKKVLRLKHVAGIGHADERVKFIDEHVVLTDTPSYTNSLSALGYEVRLLPKPERGKYRTYVNALSVNDTVFVPVFNERNDQEALAVFNSTGKKIVPVNSEQLSDYGNGSVHCITMTYPKMDLAYLRSLLSR